MGIQITPEIIVGGLSLLGGTVLTLKKTGLITFGKPAERRDCARKCAEHEQVVKDAAMATQEARATAGNLKEDIAEIRDDIKNLEKKSDEREQRMQDEFRRLRELLGELSGYVKAMHEHSK
jgi:chromosome segregation ATPase